MEAEPQLQAEHESPGRSQWPGRQCRAEARQDLAHPRRRGDKKADARSEKTAVAQAGKEKQLYTVKKGDSLASIAQKHKIPLKDLLRWNNAVSPKNLKPGQALVIYLAEEAPAGQAGSRS